MGANEIYVPENEDSKPEKAQAIRIRDQNVEVWHHERNIEDPKSSLKCSQSKEVHYIQTECDGTPNENDSNIDKDKSCQVKGERSLRVLFTNDMSDSSIQEGSNRPHSSDSMDLNVESDQSKSASIEIDAANTLNEEDNTNLFPENDDLAWALELENLDLDSNNEILDENSEIKIEQIEEQIGTNSQNCIGDSDEDCCEGNQDFIDEIQLSNDKQTDNFSSEFDVLSNNLDEQIEDEPFENLEVSTNILSYERFFPGRILGNTFIIKNIGFKTWSFRLTFENKHIDNHYAENKFLEYYGCDSIKEIEESYNKHIREKINNSKDTLNVWNIEDPFTRRLTKVIDMELDPGDEYEFIVVLKSPAINRQTLFAANVVTNFI